MPDTPSITLNKRMTYRGLPEIWSNKYHFSGPTPSDTAGWTALAAAIWALERRCIGAQVSYVGFLGHAAGNEFAVENQDFVAQGLTLQTGLGPTDADRPPGDVAVWQRWRTNDRTSRGKYIYLRKYLHCVSCTGDDIDSAAKTNLALYGTGMMDGTLPNGVKICGPQGAVAVATSTAPFASFRQLKRTGKRPSR